MSQATSDHQSQRPSREAGMQVVWNRAQRLVSFCFHGGGGDMERQAGQLREWKGFYGIIKTTHYFNERSNFCRIVNSVF